MALPSTLAPAGAAPLPKLRLPLPKPYTGTGDASLWLATIRRHCQAMSYSDFQSASLLQSLLEESALTWLYTLPTDQANDFQRLCDAFEARFGPHISSRWTRIDKFLQLRQLVGESVLTFLQRVQHEGAQLHKSDSDILDVFVKGLSSKVKAHVILQQPTSIASALEAARVAESAQSFSTENEVLELLHSMQGQIAAMQAFPPPRQYFQQRRQRQRSDAQQPR